MSDTQFYYNLNGNNAGPVSVDELIELVKAGKIERDTLIWRQGYEDWKKLSESEIDISFLPPKLKPTITPTPVIQTPPQSLSSLNGQTGIIQANSENPFMYYINAFKQYAKFSGKARRKEYWFFVLFNILFAGVLIAIDAVIGLEIWLDYDTSIFIPVLTIIYALATFIPVLAITARRLHDTGRSGWWQVLNFIPFISIIGSIVLLVFCCLDSQFGENKYGLNPKGLN